MYNHPYPFKPEPGSAKFDFHVIQSDDYGSFWDTSGAQKTLDEVEALSRRTNTLIVLFIHGWHHNAAPDDTNLTGFKASLEAMHKELSNPGRDRMRAQSTGTAEFRMVGIYVGWRGRSLPWLLDYLTFWGRKSAAERVGEGDVSEFIERLQRIFLRANASSPAADSQVPRLFTGLIAMGHSFGGQVLWKSIGRQLEDPLTRRAADMSNSLNPRAAQIREEAVAINGLGDLNILLNPAVEAYQYARVDALFREMTYPKFQTPQVVVFSADNDRARQFWFPVGRAFTSPFRPNFRQDNHGYQGKLYGKALGELVAQLTHDLNKLPQPAPDSLVESDYANPDKILDFDFTHDPIFEGIKLSPRIAGSSVSGHVPNSPVMVVQTHDKIIDGHNKIFGQDFILFLTKYVTFLEGKRLLLLRAKSSSLYALRLAPIGEATGRGGQRADAAD
jgi:hypothetical protein